MTSYTNVLKATRDMVSQYMAGYDPSHDMHHVDRVTQTGKMVTDWHIYIRYSLLRNKFIIALTIARDYKETHDDIDLELVELAALCHDVGDRKYYQGKETGGQLIERFLTEQNYAKADIVARIVDHVGFSKELGWNDETDEPEKVFWRNTCFELHA